jgi:hypothetical protein
MNIDHRRRQRGSSLIIVILIVALLAAIGIPLLTMTRMGRTIAGSARTHEEAFNAAEAGFENARLLIDGFFSTGVWTGFAGHYLTQPTGIDVPADAEGNPNASYFRRRSDQDLLAAFDSDGDGTANVPNLLAFHQTFGVDGRGATVPRVTYTVFLIDDEAGGGTSDPSDALLVSIGTVRSGNRILDSVRLEILIGFEIKNPVP